MENRCAETPDVLCDFTIHLCNIPANSLGPILKHAIIHVCQKKYENFPSKLLIDFFFIYLCIVIIYIFIYLIKMAALYRKYYFNANQKMHNQVLIH